MINLYCRHLNYLLQILFWKKKEVKSVEISCNTFSVFKREVVPLYSSPWVLVTLSRNPQAMVLSRSAPSSVVLTCSLSSLSSNKIPSCSSTAFLPMSTEIKQKLWKTITKYKTHRTSKIKIITMVFWKRKKIFIIFGTNLLIIRNTCMFKDIKTNYKEHLHSFATWPT